MYPIVSVLTLAVLVAASVYADRHLPAAERLPMRWGMTGRVLRTAPRRVALAFTPVLAACMFMALAVMDREVDGAGDRVVRILAPSFVLAHAFHLWLIHRHFRRG